MSPDGRGRGGAPRAARVGSARPTGRAGLAPAARLAPITLARALPPAACLAFAALAGLAASRAPAGAGSLAARAAEAGAASALARQDAWALAGPLALALPLVAAAAWVPRWRARDADWLAARPVGAGAALGSALLGCAFTAALLLACVAAAAETAAGAGAPAARAAAPLAHAALVVLEDGERATATLDGPVGGALERGERRARGAAARLRVPVRLGPGTGPAATAVLRVRAGAGGPLVGSARARLATHGVVEIPLASGDGAAALVLELERDGPGAALLVPRHAARLVVPAASARLASLELALRGLVLAAAWCALALGFGAWTSTATAALLPPALWLLPWALDAGAALLPGGRLPEALALVGAGLVPPPLGALELARLGTCLVLGLALARLGTRRGRAAP